MQSDSPESTTQQSSGLDVYSFLTVVIEQMAGVAWQKMGLHADPISGTTRRDMIQAKVAIDVVTDLCKYIEPQLDSEDRRQIENLKSDLRVNFVQKMAEEGK